MDLVDEHLELCLIKDNILTDEIKLWHLKEKYPDINESLKLNELYFKSVVDELHFILGGEMSDEQLKLIFT